MQESRKRANEKWVKENYEQISFRAPKGTKEMIKQLAASNGRFSFKNLQVLGLKSVVLYKHRLAKVESVGQLSTSSNG
jgi:hypothetical protein